VRVFLEARRDGLKNIGGSAPLAFFPLKKREHMKRFHPVSAWTVFKRKLKERFQHVSDDDLKGLEQESDRERGKMTTLERLQRIVGRPAFEIASLAAEAAEEIHPRGFSGSAGNEELPIQRCLIAVR